MVVTDIVAGIVGVVLVVDGLRAWTIECQLGAQQFKQDSLSYNLITIGLVSVVGACGVRDLGFHGVSPGPDVGAGIPRGSLPIGELQTPWCAVSMSIRLTLVAQDSLLCILWPFSNS